MTVNKREVEEIVSEFPCTLTEAQQSKIKELYGVALDQDEFHSVQHLVAIIQEEVDFSEPLPQKSCSLDGAECESCQ